MPKHGQCRRRGTAAGRSPSSPAPCTGTARRRTQDVQAPQAGSQFAITRSPDREVVDARRRPRSRRRRPRARARRARAAAGSRCGPTGRSGRCRPPGPGSGPRRAPARSTVTSSRISIFSSPIAWSTAARTIATSRIGTCSTLWARGRAEQAIGQVGDDRRIMIR